MGRHVVIIAGVANSLINFRRPLIEKLLARGHRVTTLAPNCDRTAQVLAAMGVVFRPVAIQRTSMNPLADIVTLLRLVMVLRQLGPDCVVSYTVKPVIYGTIAAKLAGIPRIAALITGLGYAFTDGAGYMRKLSKSIVAALYWFALRYTDVVFFQNTDDRDLFVELRLVGSGKSRVVNGSGVDLVQFSAVAAPATVSFLMISRLLRDKGVREYAMASKIIRERYPAVPFYLVGEIDSNPSAISSSELASWVSAGLLDYLGVLDDVRPALAKCAVYVLPSYREGTPRTVLEAMATGRAVITTDAPGCRETVVDGLTGFLVPIRDVDSIVAAMEKFIRNEADWISMGVAGRKLAENKFSAESVSEFIVSSLNL